MTSKGSSKQQTNNTGGGGGNQGNNNKKKNKNNNAQHNQNQTKMANYMKYIPEVDKKYYDDIQEKIILEEKNKLDSFMVELANMVEYNVIEIWKQSANTITEHGAKTTFNIQLSNAKKLYEEDLNDIIRTLRLRKTKFLDSMPWILDDNTRKRVGSIYDTNLELLKDSCMREWKEMSRMLEMKMKNMWDNFDQLIDPQDDILDEKYKHHSKKYSPRSRMIKHASLELTKLSDVEFEDDSILGTFSELSPIISIIFVTVVVLLIISNNKT